jgi:biotin transport system substrate-specific component
MTFLGLSAPNQFFWALIGLFLTIGSTFIEAFMTNPPWNWGNEGIQFQSLGVTYQIGAVLLTGCVGGKNAALLAQVAYLVIGLKFLPVFSQGGGLNYYQQPAFGYLIGFIPGAWLCGWLAFRYRAKLEVLTLSCLAGLLVIHSVGILYLLGLSLINPPNIRWLSFFGSVQVYSLNVLPGQLVLICVVSVIAFLLRKILFY